MKLKHAVITSVNRDELPDGGAGIWAETIRQIRLQAPGATIDDVSAFMTALKGTPYFGGVELKKTSATTRSGNMLFIK
mgnify:CR=1 FL=1